MRSLLILEVQHGEDTDRLSFMIDHILHEYNEMMGHHYPGRPVVTDYTLRVDVPDCFVLDSDSTNEENNVLPH